MLNSDITEDQIILRVTVEWMTDRGIAKQKFAEAYLLPALRRAALVSEEPAIGADYELWFASRRKMIGAMLNNNQNIPLSWKWPWVSCLPEPYQTRCRQELMALNGSFYLPLPIGNETRMPTVSRLADLHREFAEVIAASRPAHDGMLDARDAVGDLREYAGQLLDLVERATQELMNIQIGTGVISQRQMMAMLNGRLGSK